MVSGIGVSITEKISVAVITDHSVIGEVVQYPEDSSEMDSLQGIPAEELVEKIAELIGRLKTEEPPTHIGIGIPGIVRHGVVEDSPNLLQFKGLNVMNLVSDAVAHLYPDVPVRVLNDADAMAAGMAASRGQLDRLIRLWFLGTGIGFGRYPVHDGIWEAGHSVVTLDPKETFCGCGGKGHVEGIMGQRSMRLRFMDLEPDEVFEQAKAGETRCVDFVKLWHRALAAATATSIHMSGPGKFFITGVNAKFVNLSLLNEYLSEMVKLSPIQNYTIEIVPGGQSFGLIGAAVTAAQAAGTL